MKIYHFFTTITFITNPLILLMQSSQCCSIKHMIQLQQIWRLKGGSLGYILHKVYLCSTIFNRTTRLWECIHYYTWYYLKEWSNWQNIRGSS